MLGCPTIRSLNFTFVYVSAPYDVPFNRFGSDSSIAVPWNEHVTTELLEPWSRLPYFVCGFSGGAALALNGLERASGCFGAAAFGADAITSNFECPKHWGHKLRLYCAPNDRVCNAAANVRVAETLISRNQAERISLRMGGHLLADYSTLDSLGDVICFANEIAPFHSVNF